MPLLFPTPLWPGSHVMVELIPEPVTTLAPDEVFVFGSNAAGFHGAGSAGLACRGDSGTGWRNDPRFRAMMAAAPRSAGRVGRWAVYGVGRGHQVGTEGQSYAIETIERPGRAYRRGTPLTVIAAQLHKLVAFATTHRELRFIITPIGEGFAGYSTAEMATVWRQIDAQRGIPDSFRFVRVWDGVPG
jgi:hypothetical protein